MEIRHQKSKKKIIIAVIIIVILVVVAVVGIMAYRNSRNDESTQKSTDSTQSDENIKSSDDADESNSSESDETTDENDSESDDTDSSTNNDPTNGGKTPPRYEGGYVQDSENLTGDISGISVVGDNLSVRVTINQFITDPDGRCELTLTSPSGANYQYWSDLIQNPQTTSCYGWDIPVSELGGNVSGHWSATVTVSGDNRTGTFTKEVDL